MVLQFFISFLADGWKLFSGDVEAAFLQGTQQGRTLFMRPPRDALINALSQEHVCDVALGDQPAKIRILGNVVLPEPNEEFEINDDDLNVMRQKRTNEAPQMAHESRTVFGFSYILECFGPSRHSFDFPSLRSSFPVHCT